MTPAPSYITGITFEQLKNMYAEKGYEFFDKDKYHVNIFGLRNKDLETVDQFNDYLGVAFLDQFLNPRILLWAGTTKPGLSWLGQEMANPNGTGILTPDQHKNAWKIGFHHAGKPEQYEAFVQAGEKVFKVWRDNDKDGKLDFSGKIYDDVGGLNGHRAGVNDTFKVGLYSAACQVWQDDKEHSIAVAVAKRNAELYKNLFHYTLFQLQ